jgi:hypothetical protein
VAAADPLLAEAVPWLLARLAAATPIEPDWDRVLLISVPHRR